jgi:PhzF family phenazine biosynthesis protein
LRYRSCFWGTVIYAQIPPSYTLTRLFHVDAFADEMFTGNPAAVCLLDGPREESWMQNLAAEMNLSETAFVWPQKGGFGLRWFTPKVEVALCGHATLASAHAMWEAGVVPRGRDIIFHTKSGRLVARSNGNLVELDFPSKPPTPSKAPRGLSEALGAHPVYVGRNEYDYLYEVATEEELRSLSPDFTRLAKIGTRGVIVTCLAKSKRYDFVSRFFAPAVGVYEDPVTGSAHCCLGPFWSNRLKKEEMVGYQASARGGVVRVKVEGDRVILGGMAVTVLSAELAEPTT